MTADNSNSKKMKRKEYEKHLHKLQFELCRLQDWVKAEESKLLSYLRAVMRPARAEQSRPSRNE